MPLKLMYVTNRPEIALIAEGAGVDRIFVDMEYIGKSERQRKMDTVQNHHTVEDVKTIRAVLSKAQLLVRVNPIHKAREDYFSSEDEINAVIAAGADIIMLPFFKTPEEVEKFIAIVNGRARTLLLLETPEAAEQVDRILAIPGIDEIHIGINDLSIGYKKTFMFEVLADGTVERLCMKIKQAGIPYGFGGVASIGKGMLPAEMILKEHYRLESSMAILSRTFCDMNRENDLALIRNKFDVGVQGIRDFEKEVAAHMDCFDEFEENKRRLVERVARIVNQIQAEE